MLTVHHLGISQSDRIVWLCEELEIPYDLVVYERDPVTRLAPPEFKALHPSGTAPVITDGAVVLAETGAVVDYIVAKHGGGRLTIPASDPAFADFLYWYHFSNGSLIPAMMAMAGDGGLAPIMRDRVERYIAALEAHLAKGKPWLVGDSFTVADIMILFPLTTMRAFIPVDLTDCPAIRAYIRRLVDRPAFQRAKAKADPDLVLPID